MSTVAREYAVEGGRWRRFWSSDAGPSQIGENGDALRLRSGQAGATYCGAFEFVTFFYLSLINTLIVAFHSHLASAPAYVFIHRGIAVAILSLAYAARRWPCEWLRFIRHWYPLPLYIFCFEELRGLVHLIFPGWFDAWLIRFDYSLGHVHPSLWLTRFASAPLNDFMQACYMTYFIYLVALPALLYFRSELRAFWTVMTATALAHYSVYVISILFPIESPHFALASVQPHLAGGASTALINLIERFGRVHGGAFPSAHVAGSMVAILASWRYRRWLFWLCLPFFVGMMIATVYGGYHYVADVLAGMMVGAIGWIGANRLQVAPACPELRRASLPASDELRRKSKAGSSAELAVN